MIALYISCFQQNTPLSVTSVALLALCVIYFPDSSAIVELILAKCYYTEEQDEV
jgi:hypothetical protein